MANESASVYAQLGFADAEEMLVKAQLVSKIGEILRELNGASSRQLKCWA